jgi:aspartate aminotransferase
MTRLAARAGRLSVSPTMRVTATVDRLRRDGVTVIDLGAGEPDFATPADIGDAGHLAIEQNFTKYTPVGGIIEVKRAICRRYLIDYGVEYSESEVILSAGGKQALFNTALALFGPGDEVIVHTPYWPTVIEQVKLADATPVLVQTLPEDGFAIKAAPFLDAIGPRTRGIIITSPCNPTGALIAEAELELIARAAARHDIWVVIDLCYEKLIYDATPHNLPRVLASHCPGLGVLCGSASKAYAMTGWRCGWTIAAAPVVAAEHAIQSHATSNVTSIAQKAVLEALTGSQAAVVQMLDEYRERRDHLHAWLSVDERLHALKPAGTFYLWLDVRPLLANDGIATSTEFAQALLDTSRVAVTPGEAFGAPGFIRLSFATSMDQLREGSRRILEFVQQSQKPTMNA